MCTKQRTHNETTAQPSYQHLSWADGDVFCMTADRMVNLMVDLFQNSSSPKLEGVEDWRNPGERVTSSTTQCNAKLANHLGSLGSYGGCLSWSVQGKVYVLWGGILKAI